jgi:hypothetical protein
VLYISHFRGRQISGETRDTIKLWSASTLILVQSMGLGTELSYRRPSLCSLAAGTTTLFQDQAFSPSYDLTPPPTSSLSSVSRLSLSHSSCVSPKGGGGRWGRIQIIPRRESLVLYKPFDTLWPLYPPVWSGVYLRNPIFWNPAKGCTGKGNDEELSIHISSASPLVWNRCK